MNSNGIKIVGTVRHVLRDAEGKLIREWTQQNTIENQLKYRIAQHLGDGTYNYGVDALFTTDAVQGGAEDGNDGIVISDANNGHTMVTTKESGGAGSTNAITFKGVYLNGTGVDYIATLLYLGRVLDWIDVATPYATFQFATQTISVTIPNNAQYTVHWTLTFS